MDPRREVCCPNGISDKIGVIIGNGLGHWEVTVEPLADAIYEITTEVEDLAGNISTGLFPILSQITDTTGGFNARPSINADGTRTAFDSNRDPLGTNADGNIEIFLFDTTSGLTQITTTLGASGNNEPSINADGTRIAFQSDLDLVAGGNADGNFEIFLFDATSTLSQITRSSVKTFTRTIDAICDEPIAL